MLASFNFYQITKSMSSQLLGIIYYNDSRGIWGSSSTLHLLG